MTSSMRMIRMPEIEFVGIAIESRSSAATSAELVIVMI